MKYWSFIKDPLYGYIHITELERDVIDTLALQRLRRIKQLVFADYVYPGANHTRFEHSVGVMHLAGLLAKSLPEEFTEEEIQEVRLAGLLHDVGHGPFSHTFEQLLMRRLGKTHEDLAPWIILNTELKDIIESYGYSAERVAKLAVGRLRDEKKPYLDQIIQSAVDVDKMDFIMRDSYHTGAEYGKVDIYRLIYTMEIYGDTLAVSATALPTLEAFVIARIESFRAIYYHKTARAGQILLVRAMELADNDIGLTSFREVHDYLKLDDYYVWTMLRNHREAGRIMADLERRKLLKCAYERIFHVHDEAVSSLLTNDSVRKRVEEEIARRAGIEEEEIAIDVPSLPSIPYFHTMKMDPMEIPVVEERAGQKVLRKAAELSKVIEVLKGFMNIIRVYTVEEYKDKVRQAAEEILGKPPETTRVSY